MAKYGIIYIIRNEFHPSGVYKIGFTTNSIHERVDELNRQTSNPGKFEICGYFPVTNVTEVEKLCHRHMERIGFIKRKEFFEGPIDRILIEVERVCYPFKPEQFISKKYMNSDTNSYRNTKRKEIKCSTCNGEGRVRESRGFITVEKSCSNCNGNGMVWI